MKVSQRNALIHLQEGTQGCNLLGFQKMLTTRAFVGVGWLDVCRCNEKKKVSKKSMSNATQMYVLTFFYLNCFSCDKIAECL